MIVDIDAEVRKAETNRLTRKAKTPPSRLVPVLAGVAALFLAIMAIVYMVAASPDAAAAPAGAATEEATGD